MQAMKSHSECHQRQRGKNIALVVVLLALVGIFYAVTLVRMGGA